MKTRIEKLCAYLEKCKTFSDVGCDHGYCTRYMVENGLCESAVISDISAKSLKKAEILLEKYMSSGIVNSVCCNGLEGVAPSSLTLIAGMGGEEIINVLTAGYIPEKFVFQPMKNAEKLRSYLLENGCNLIADDLFFADGKYYFVIKGEKIGGCEKYSDKELKFGRHSLKNREILGYINQEREKIETYLLNDLSEQTKRLMLRQITYLTEIENECKRNFSLS